MSKGRAGGGTHHINYKSSPTFTRVHHSTAPVKAVVGPVGSGSSTGAFWDQVMSAMVQEPNEHGVRETVHLIIRATYPKLRTTVKRTIRNWFPSPIFTFSGQAPIEGHMHYPLADKTVVDATFYLMSIDSAESADFDLRSFEPTTIWMNEAREMHKDVLTNGLMRIGRFPPVRRDKHDNIIFAGATRPMIIADTNAPDDDHWMNEFFEEQKWREDPDQMKAMQQLQDKYGYDKLVDIFYQPGGLRRNKDAELEENPLAENVHNLPGGYGYYWQIVANKPDSVETDVLNNWGTSHAGKAVYGGYYNPNFHEAKEPIRIDPSLPILCGIDWGVNFSAYVFAQYSNATLNILRELVIKDEGLDEQAQTYFLPFVRQEFMGLEIQAFCDPSGAGRLAESAKTYDVKFAELTGIRPTLAGSNKELDRINAVKSYLRKSGGFLLDPSCGILRKGFRGRYYYERKRIAGATHDVFKDKVAKDKIGVISHPQDSVQYICFQLNSVMAAQDIRQEPVGNLVSV